MSRSPSPSSRRSLARLALVLGLSVGTAWAGPLRDQVLPQLQGIEDPPSAEALRALGPGVAAELLELSEDGELPRSVRAKAVHALGWFPSPETRAALVARLDGSDRILARKAAYALGEGWGAGAIPELTRALEAPDSHLREAAARALGGVDSPEAVAVLEARLAVEESSSVKATITKSLGR